MDPVAFSFNGLEIRWYGIFTALAFIVGYLTVRYRIRQYKVENPASYEQLVFWGLIGGIIGARLLYVFQYWEHFAGDLLEIFRIDHGGLVFQGGLIGAFALGLLIAGINKAGIRLALDIFAPALALAHAVGRIGCFLNGCCFGEPYRGPLAVQYPAGSPASYVQRELGIIPDTIGAIPEAVFPIQLVASAGNLIIFFLLLLLQRRLKVKGQLFAMYVMLYSVIRFTVEFGRGDYLDSSAGLTPAQSVGMVLFPLALLAFIGLQKFRSRAVQAGDR
ncbi:MAG: prolipoprotein diacylglyceryl transferase [Verrucomicrobiota bacterium]